MSFDVPLRCVVDITNCYIFYLFPVQTGTHGTIGRYVVSLDIADWERRVGKSRTNIFEKVSFVIFLKHFFFMYINLKGLIKWSWPLDLSV